ncbi:MAG: regulatory protein RecX [Bdellovibrionales bacterium]|nr:regulatory protein RecX [Bdellovibrionales bacterium]
MTLLTKRDHSEKELKQKLSRAKKWDSPKERLYSDKEIAEVIAWAKEYQWIKEGAYLSERWAETLNRKKKGIYYINSYLNQKGLPEIKKDQEIEIEKALGLLKLKSRSQELTLDVKSKLTRFLKSRGFDNETIQMSFKLFQDQKKK